MKGINIFLADGFEDVEALATNDVLRRGGAATRLVSISNVRAVRSSHGVTVIADCTLGELDTDSRGTSAGDVMIFPGGMPGSKNLASCGVLMDAMKSHYAAGGTVAAICAAPGLVLSQLEDLEGVAFTCFDGFESYLEAKGAEFTPEPAVCCGRIITGRSAGHATSFGLEILNAIEGQEAAGSVAYAMYLE